MKSDSDMKQLAFLLNETSGLMKRRFEQVARPTGLTLLQWRTLRHLDESGPMRQVALGEALEAAPMTVSDLADRLEKAGLITRDTDPDDSRAKILTITALGGAKLADMRQIATATFAEILSGMTDTEIAAVRDGLMKMKNNLGAG